MGSIFVDSPAADPERREQLYSGSIFFYEPRPKVRALRDHAWDLISEAFDPIDPQQAQDTLAVEKFVERVAPLKTRFTHSERAKELLRELLANFGCDLASTYFDLPKLRVVTHSGYLTAGVGYAYKPHRDIWYAAPPCQLNWWFPLVEIAETSAMAFHPQYWTQPVPNSSGEFDPYVWNATGRRDAAKFIHSDTRKHPAPLQPISLDVQTRIVGPACSMLMFSAAHLHSTVPNTSGRTRYSIDFRTASLEDLERGRGSPNIDNRSKGTTLRDFLRASDFSPLPAEVIERYDTGVKSGDEELVFVPSP